MGWKEQMGKTTARIKQGARDKTIGRAENWANLQKDKFNHSTLGKVAQAKGFKGKAGALGKGAAKKLKGYNAYKKAQEAIKKIQKVASFLISHGKVILIVTAVVTLIWNGAIFVIGITQALGSTPHYYCEIDADEGIKQTSLYKQYCSKGSSAFELENLNGHYVSQDGSGPCTCCSSMNLLLRYFTKHDINVYDYMWGEDGQYDIDKTVNVSDTEHMQGGTTFRKFTNGNSYNITTCTAKFGEYGSRNFALANGKPGYTMANWGYVRDDTLDYTDVEMDDSFTDFNGNNEKWVWDLSIETNNGPGSTWGAVWGSRAIIIDGVTATFEYVPGDWGDADGLRQLLDEHPSGVIVYRNYGSNLHAILVTGYKEDVFYVVDSGFGTMGGFEGPATSSLFCIQSCWTNEVLKNPSGHNVQCYIYIKEDTPN